MGGLIGLLAQVRDLNAAAPPTANLNIQEMLNSFSDHVGQCPFILLGAFLNRSEFLVGDPRSYCFLFDVFLLHGYMVGYIPKAVNMFVKYIYFDNTMYDIGAVL